MKDWILTQLKVSRFLAQMLLKRHGIKDLDSVTDEHPEEVQIAQGLVRSIERLYEAVDNNRIEQAVMDAWQAGGAFNRLVERGIVDRKTQKKSCRDEKALILIREHWDLKDSEIANKLSAEKLKRPDGKKYSPADVKSRRQTIRKLGWYG